MPGLLNVGEMSALAMHVLVELGKEREAGAECRLSVPELARRLQASTHTLHKVVARLAANGMVDGARGPAGGVRLAADPKSVSLLRVVEAIDGTVSLNGCLFEKRVCAPGAPCLFSGLTCALEREIHAYFARTTLDTLLEPVAAGKNT